MVKLRPVDLAREHGLSTQAVRNYESDGFLPPAERTPSGYRVYTRRHAAALDALLAAFRAYGHATGGEIMRAATNREFDDVLMLIDDGHRQLARDRGTLDAVRAAVDRLIAEPVAEPDGRPDPTARGIGELAHRLSVTPATLRNWEAAGILAPERDRATGFRVFGAADLRDAELAHLLRRGGYRLDHIATVVERVRAAGGTAELADALDDWRRKLTERGLAMLEAAARLNDYLRLLTERTDP